MRKPPRGRRHGTIELGGASSTQGLRCSPRLKALQVLTFSGICFWHLLLAIFRLGVQGEAEDSFSKAHSAAGCFALDIEDSAQAASDLHACKRRKAVSGTVGGSRRMRQRSPESRGGVPGVSAGNAWAGMASCTGHSEAPGVGKAFRRALPRAASFLSKGGFSDCKQMGFRGDRPNKI